ncbi:hypothetical protein YH66_12080 [[Brevibacterium] flavum]|uniref:Uncharacterized protein n=1 Tax=[Brevibacterium] flavum TaxID=92706 RepID=A0A0F6SRM7_9CORY|nr:MULTISPECIES: hypothetical protein [Corynebacterium]AKF28229.1 hypothetical protein YH66_12080 [[Brevibacterium] flavum]ANE09068.1 hypothetical protein A3654_12150 [Corynebacterium glutamicum]AST21478.1 hypothetical protein CEY17_12250 [Corynebacterium glutamicum ATCC 14067]KIH73023.1 hypothetical protein SD36_12135 [Corynebacterium glutamicum]OKX95621.1 hypothetical protein AUP71_03565 [Corynebacterium glutamicum]
MSNLRELLKKELSKSRPARYSMDDRKWIDDVADKIDPNKADLEIKHVVRDYIRTIAKEVEGKATRAGNQLMREFFQEEALPFNWQQMVNEPIALENMSIVDGQIKLLKERVRLRDATPRDFELWAQTEDRARQRDYEARGEAVSGAMQIAQRMRRAGTLTFWQWAESQEARPAA